MTRTKRLDIVWARPPLPDAINVSCEAPETAYKDWGKEQGDYIHQGPHAQLTMMLHSLSKEASVLLCEGVLSQGKYTG